MSRLFYHVMQDNAGNLLFDVTGTMRLAGTGTAATIYGDEALTVVLPNPMTNHPSFGSFKCFLGAGDYDFYMAKSGYTFETLTGVQGHGSMAQQDASAVVVERLAVSAALPAGVGDVLIGNRLAIGTTISASHSLHVGAATLLENALGVRRPKATAYGMTIQPTDTDTGMAEIAFLNAAGAGVGFIQTTATTTTYATTSDARLKCNMAPLTGALDVIRALRPITHRWKADNSRGVGFRAHEVQQLVDGVITGEPGAVDEEGHIVPQMIDYGKLVPWLCAAVKELTEQVDTLRAKLEGVGA